MMVNSTEQLEYYSRELTYLRRMGMSFAEMYPKVAGRLELGPDVCTDPHVERLIESFAFLTARIQQQIDSEFPQLSQGLLGTLYPQFLSPIPSMTVARFQVDPDQGKLTGGHMIPGNTPLITRTRQGDICRFRTCYPVELWPLDVSFAGFESIDQYEFLDMASDVAIILKIRIECLSGRFSELGISRLRFYLNGERMLVNSLYELLFCHTSRVGLLPDNSKKAVMLPPGSILPVGFNSDEAVLPYPETAHDSYRLIHEYFTFPQKYFFFDLDLMDGCIAEKYVDLLLMFERPPENRLVVDRRTFCLGCTPIINLFNKTTDPIRLSEKKSEYRLNPDKYREATTEIHSILSVSGTFDPADGSQNIDPYFSCRHFHEKTENQVFWQTRRQGTGRKDLPGSEMLISFVDLSLNIKNPAPRTIFAHTLCTNRRLAEELPAGACLEIEKEAPLTQIVTLAKPTLQIDPPLNGATLWRLISHLSLNHLSLGNNDNSLRALQEILKLYSFSNKTSAHNQIAGLRKMSCHRVIKRMGKDAWRGFCRGTQITLEFDERLFVGSSAFILASVLERFFALYCSINSFTQLRIKSIQREGIWKQWQPRAGEQLIL